LGGDGREGEEKKKAEERDFPLLPFYVSKISL
jgi:hypothetical protein